jgi:hypothetical protein
MANDPWFQPDPQPLLDAPSAAPIVPGIPVPIPPLQFLPQAPSKPPAAPEPPAPPPEAPAPPEGPGALGTRPAFILSTRPDRMNAGVRQAAG